jgi:hypothetical protein
MGERENVLLTQSGIKVSRKDALAAIESQIKANPEGELRFVISPLVADAEFSTVLGNLAKVADTNHCNGCD